MSGIYGGCSDVVTSADGGGSRHVCFCSEASRASFAPNLLTSLSALFRYPLFHFMKRFLFIFLLLLLLLLQTKKTNKSNTAKKKLAHFLNSPNLHRRNIYDFVGPIRSYAMVGGFIAFCSLIIRQAMKDGRADTFSAVNRLTADGSVTKCGSNRPD